MSNQEPTQQSIAPGQAKYLWSFEIRNSTTRPIAWLECGINRSNAAYLIEDCETWEKDKTDEHFAMVKGRLRLWSPDFELKTAAPTPAPVAPTPEPIEVTKKVTITQGMKLDDIILEILPVVNGATIISDLFEAKVPTLPNVVTSKEYHKPENFDMVLAMVQCLNVNVLINGPAGSGKSLMGAEIAKCLDLPFYCLSCLADMRYVHIFGGDKLIVDPTTGKTVSKFQTTAFVEAIQKPGVVMIDEIFSLEAGILIGMNGLLEPSTRAINIAGKLVKRDPNNIIIATTNVDGRNNDRNHAGAKRVDGSSLDRFATVFHTYSKKVEKNILARLPKIPRQDVGNWLNKLRKQLKLSNIAFDPSTRRLNTCVNLIAGSVPHADAFTFAFLGQLSATELKKIGMEKLESDNTTEVTV